MQDGQYDNITIDQYHGNSTHLSATQLKLAKKSLKELDWTRRGLIPKSTGKHFDFGNAFELALLNAVEFSENVAILEDKKLCDDVLLVRPELVSVRASKEYKTAVSKFNEDNQKKYIIMDYGDQSYETIKHMLESCMQDKIIQGLIRNTEYQLSVFWTDPKTGLKLKTRPDICKRKKNVIVNVKTTEDGSPKGFGKDLVKYDYPLQACHEITGCLAGGVMETVDNYFWLVVEKQPPFNATVYEFDQDDIALGMDELHYLYNRVKKAQDQNFYPGYSDRSDNEYGILRAPIPMFYRSF